MSKYGDPTQGLRFGAWVRVSTEKQEKRGESLRVQHDSEERDVAHMGGTVVEWYGGQEHATPGWEKKELKRLIADAARGKFDAVIVAYHDRWDRGDKESDRGLEVFKEHGIRFFVGAGEIDLFDPQDEFMMDVHGALGKFVARQQSKKSIDSRVQRARDGLPAAGRLPFGRTFDPHTETWGVDPTKKAVVEEAARRYLAGEKMPAIAKSLGMNPTQLHKTLMQKCGPEWVQRFRSKALNIDERVVTPVPALLDEATIAAYHARAEGNRTWARTPAGPVSRSGRRFRTYLLSRVVFCQCCGRALTGQAIRDRFRYYRTTAGCACHAKRQWVPAEDLEEAVLEDLFQLFGNADRVRKAVEAAVPDQDKVAQDRAQLSRVSGDLEKVRAGRDRLIDAITEGAVTAAHAKAKLAELDSREQALAAERDGLAALLEGLPTPEEVEAQAERASAAFKATLDRVNRDYDTMTWEEKRALLGMVFGGKLPDGRRLGVYVERDDRPGRRVWYYRIMGRLVEAGGVTPRPPVEESPYDPEMWGSGADYQEALLAEAESVTITPWPRRRPGRTPCSTSASMRGGRATRTSR
jgi:DNA invertase Pin-like site-specific DNA recombinase